MSGSFQPAAYLVVDEVSAAAQDEAKRWIRYSLVLGVVAAACGITTWRVGSRRIDVLSIIGVAAFAGVLTCGIMLRVRRCEERWTDSRATAEGILGLAWLYAIGGAPFPVDQPADADFTHAVQAELHGLSRGTPPLITGPPITDAMRTRRALPLPDRQAVYLSERIAQQTDWYASKAQRNTDLARQWANAIVAANIAGLIAGLLRTFNAFDFDLLGFAAAIAGSATAWTRARQHRELARTYTTAATNLSLLRSRLETATTEPAWSALVSEAETLMSAEHRTWHTRRSP